MYDVNPLSLKLHLADLDRQFADAARRPSLPGWLLRLRRRLLTSPASGPGGDRARSRGGRHLAARRATTRRRSRCQAAGPRIPRPRRVASRHATEMARSDETNRRGSFRHRRPSTACSPRRGGRCRCGARRRIAAAPARPAGRTHRGRRTAAGGCHRSARAARGFGRRDATPWSGRPRRPAARRSRAGRTAPARPARRSRAADGRGSGCRVVSPGTAGHPGRPASARAARPTGPRHHPGRPRVQAPDRHRPPPQLTPPAPA